MQIVTSFWSPGSKYFLTPISQPWGKPRFSILIVFRFSQSAVGIFKMRKQHCRRTTIIILAILGQLQRCEVPSFQEETVLAVQKLSGEAAALFHEMLDPQYSCLHYPGRNNLQSFLATNSSQNHFPIACMLSFGWHSRQKCRVKHFEKMWQFFI